MPFHGINSSLNICPWNFYGMYNLEKKLKRKKEKKMKKRRRKRYLRGEKLAKNWHAIGNLLLALHFWLLNVIEMGFYLIRQLCILKLKSGLLLKLADLRRNTNCMLSDNTMEKVSNLILAMERCSILSLLLCCFFIFCEC